MTKYFEKVYQNPKNQIYVQHGDILKFDMNFIYIYINNENKIEEMVSNEFPLLEFSQFKGFLFAKKKSLIPTLPDSFINNFKTNIKNLNYQFTNQKFDIVLKFTGYLGCSPRINNDAFYGFTYDKFLNISEKEINKMYNDFFKMQTIKSIDEWVKHIREKCPYNVNYCKKIDENAFKNEIYKSDIMIEYDIRHDDEITLIKKVEEIFEDKDEVVLVLNDFNDTLEKITKIVSKRDDIVAIRDKDKLLIKYNDLLKLGLSWSLENFY